MTDVDAAVQSMAYIAALEKKLAARKAEIKASLLGPNKRRTEHAVDDQGDELAKVIVKWLNANPDPTFSIEDESQVLAWAVEQFGEGSIDVDPRLSAQGRSDLKAAVKRAWAAGQLIPGVKISDPAEKVLSVSVTPVPDIADRVQAMVDRGALSLVDLLAIEPARPEAAA